MRGPGDQIERRLVGRGLREPFAGGERGPLQFRLDGNRQQFVAAGDAGHRLHREVRPLCPAGDRAEPRFVRHPLQRRAGHHLRLRGPRDARDGILVRQHLERAGQVDVVRRLDQRFPHAFDGLGPRRRIVSRILEKPDERPEVGHLLDRRETHFGRGILARDLDQKIHRLVVQTAHRRDPHGRILALPGRLRPNSFKQLH